MKRSWIYLLILVIFAINLLAACSPGGSASGGINCSHGGEVCVNLSTVQSFAMGDAVPITITVTSSKDISDLQLKLQTGAEITINGPQTWEKNISNPTIDKGIAYGTFDIKAGQTLTFHRLLHFPQKEGYFDIVVVITNIGGTIAAHDYFSVLLTKDVGGQVTMAGTRPPPHTPNVTSAAYGPGTPAPSPLMPTNTPMLTPTFPLVATYTPVAPAYPPPSSSFPSATSSPYP